MAELLINEIFGPTLQGECVAAGRQCAFIRLAICPLRCKWCDTPYTWAFTPGLANRHQSGIIYSRNDEVHRMDVDTIVKEALKAAAGSNLVIISGGEPLAQVSPTVQGTDTICLDIEKDPLGGVVQTLWSRGVSVHIETAGVRFPSGLINNYVEQYVVSPKLASSGNHPASRMQPDVLAYFASNRKAVFKFVICGIPDFAEVADIVERHRIEPWRVWLMPEGTKADVLQERMPLIAAHALKNGYNVSTRLHVLIWGDQRGR